MLIEQMDATVFPVRPTRGVNRGYRDEYFRADGSSIVVQGAGTPTIYRGDRYPTAAQGNAFVTDSPTNLVHQFVLTEQDGHLAARNAYPRGEFFASSDERCRPVNLFSAPDGTMYIVDMYRGVVQAGGLWTDYLTSYIKQHDLQLPVARGRIWRVVYGTGASRRGPKPSLSSATPAARVATLAHPNGWWRDTAQRLLVERGDRSVAPSLDALARSASDWRTRLHALWTLDGLNAIEMPTIERALSDRSPDVRAAAVRIAERWLGGAVTPLTTRVLAMRGDSSWTVRRQLAASIGEMPAGERVSAAAAILERDGDDPIIVDALVSGLKGVEFDVLARVLQPSAAAPTGEAVTMLSAAVAKSGAARDVVQLLNAAADGASPASRTMAILRGLDAGLPARGARPARAGGLPGLSAPGGRVVITPGRGVSLPAEPAALEIHTSGAGEISALARSIAARLDWPGKPAPAGPIVAPLTDDEQKRFETGRGIFANLCAGCHGTDGRGKEHLAPDLVSSKYVQANPQVPIRIVVGGKEGPVGLMPPLAGTLTDEQIAAALTYVRREWGHTASPVAEIDVREVRQSTSMHKGPWTEAELSSMLAGTGRGRGGQ
jgi:mono/diheme cytochrome c family protein